MKISSDDQASLMHIVETHAPTNVSESGKFKYEKKSVEYVAIVF